MICILRFIILSKQYYQFPIYGWYSLLVFKTRSKNLNHRLINIVKSILVYDINQTSSCNLKTYLTC